LNDNDPKSIIRKARVLNAIKKWIRFNEVQDNQVLVDKIISFANKVIAAPIHSQHPYAHQMVKLLTQNSQNSPQPNPHYPRLKRSNTLSILRKTVDFDSVSFCDIDPAEFSRHITAGDWKCFRKLKPSELINKAWSSDAKKNPRSTYNFSDRTF